MEPLKMYFAGNVPLTLSQMITAEGVTNRLVSFAYPNEFKVWLNATEGTPGSIIIDSGAFSAWNRGAVVDIHAYIDYALECIEKGNSSNKTIHVVNLDVIPGEVGGTKALNAMVGSTTTLSSNQKVINAAARRGLRNLKIMKKAGITPIHVFHQGEDWEWLERMVELTDYIGVSPANDMPLYSKKAWIYSVFEYMYKKNIKVQTHGFAVWVIDLLKDLPWTSADAASWKINAAMGKIFFPNKGYEYVDFGAGPSSYHIIKISDRLGKPPSTALQKLVLTSGLTYDELKVEKNRCVANCKFYLAMEEWINAYKQKNEYKLTNRLF